MQVFHAQRVEMDLCGACGGVWLDRNGLERVAGRMLAETPREGTPHRLCAGCDQPLAPLLVEGEQVEGCESCRGIYLDKGELDQLAMRRISFQGPAVTHALDGAVLTFLCPGCGNEFPASQGCPRGRGLVCEGCAPRLGVRKPSEDPWPGALKRTAEDTVGDVLLGTILKLFS